VNALHRMIKLVRGFHFRDASLGHGASIWSRYRSADYAIWLLTGSDPIRRVSTCATAVFCITPCVADWLLFRRPFHWCYGEWMKTLAASPYFFYRLCLDDSASIMCVDNRGFEG
jgi:hypothetical protein